jgi:hypothetical protein
MVVLFVLFLGLSRIRIVVMEIEEKTKRNEGTDEQNGQCRGAGKSDGGNGPLL